jgi:uncharacterized membrane protein
LPEASPVSVVPPSSDLKPLRDITLLVYVLQACGFFCGGVTCIVAVIINYVKRPDTAGTWLASHFRWQIRTFWFSLLWAVIGALLLLVIVGWVVLVADGIWVIYRIVKGWLYLNDGKSMYVYEPVR